jgi:uncharacterized Zn finger protein (UPF0148 family)
MTSFVAPTGETMNYENVDCAKHCPGCGCTKIIIGREGFTLCGTCKFALATDQFEGQQKLWQRTIRFFLREDAKLFGQQHHIDDPATLADHEEVRAYLDACLSHLPPRRTVCTHLHTGTSASHEIDVDFLFKK